MFHLQSLELLHWDYCQRVSLPLDGNIITIAGPNGSGKTTLLDALRTLLGLECSGGRTYKTYARHANAETAWLRALVDNRPRSRQLSDRPFHRAALFKADQITLACRIERQGGDWVRRYFMFDGVIEIEQLAEKAERDWLGVETWRKRLEAAGLTRAIGRVLALEQGQTDRLCELSPKELLRLVFEVFGDQEVLDRYEQARSHQQQLAKEVEVAAGELARTQAQLSELANRVTSYRQWQIKIEERERLATEVLPVMQWSESRERTAREARELHRSRLFAAADARALSAQRQELHQLFGAQEAARQRLIELETGRKEARSAFDTAREAEKPVEQLVKREAELRALADVEADAAALAARTQQLAEERDRLRGDYTRWNDKLKHVQGLLAELRDTRLPPPPPEVGPLRRALDEAGIAHHVVADAIDIADERWRAAAEGVLRGARWVVVLKHRSDEGRAFEIAARLRYRHYVVADASPVGQAPNGSLLAALQVTAPLPSWLARQLAGIRCVASTEEGAQVGGEWITPEAYYRDGRGGRSVWISPAEHQFGANAVAGRRTSLEGELARIDAELTRVAKAQNEAERQFKDAQRAAQGHKAAAELSERAEEFAEANARLPALRQARAEASSRMQSLDAEHDRLVKESARSEDRYTAAQARLAETEKSLAEREREHARRRTELHAAAVASREQRGKFPRSWVTAIALAALRQEFENAHQAGIRARKVDEELERGVWETDASVIDRHARMEIQVREQDGQLSDRRASNALAATAASNARERYIDVLRATVRRYKKNVAELGELAGVVAEAQLPHLDNDDTVLAQAGLHVKFNFDGKGEVGLNDGEASGGQQVLKSLILLVGLMKDDETPGGFVFIDEPFAHLDVRNIQLVGHFLRSTRAQYLLTTPITHNVEVFEPSEITLVTSKKPRGERWAPPIAVLARRPEVSAYD